MELYDAFYYHWRLSSILLPCGEDYIIVCYDKTKAYKTGEKVSDNHIYYDNPFDPLVSIFLALGGWISLEFALLKETEYLFQEDNKEANAASQPCCSQLTELFKGYHDKLVQFIQTETMQTLMEFKKEVQ